VDAPSLQKGPLQARREPTRTGPHGPGEHVSRRRCLSPSRNAKAPLIARIGDSDTDPASPVEADMGSNTGRVRRLWGSLWPPGPAFDAIGIFLLPALVYHRMLTPGWAPVAYDYVNYMWPSRHYLVEAWRQRRWLPLWNPDIMMGFPFLADLQNGALYPPSLLFLWLPTEAGLAWTLVLHLGLAGAGMYCFVLKTLRLGRPGSAAAALTFMFSAFMTSHMEHLTFITVLAWALWLLLAVDRLLRRPRPWLVVATALLTALVILAGNAQPVYWTALIMVVVAVRALWYRLRHDGVKGVLQAMGATAGAGALGLAISAAQILPTVELVTQSIRKGGLTLTAGGSSSAAAYSLPMKHILSHILPEYVYQQSPEYAGGVGVVALVLAALVLVTRWRRPGVVLLTLLCPLAVWAATGPAGLFYDALYLLLPGFNFFRVPGRMVFFSTFALALLAGMGTRTALQLLRAACRRPSWRPRLARVLAATTVLAALPPLVLLAGHLLATEGGKRALLPSPVATRDVVLIAAFAAGALLILAVGGLLRIPKVPVALVLLAVLGADLVAAGAPAGRRHPLPAEIFYSHVPAVQLVRPDLNTRYLAIVSKDREVPVDPAFVSRYGLTPADTAVYAAHLALVDSLHPNVGMGQGLLTPDGYDPALSLDRYVSFRRSVLSPDNANYADFTIDELTQQVWSCDWLRLAAVETVLTLDGEDPNTPSCHALVRTGSAGKVAAWRPAGPPATRAWVESAGGTRRAARVVSDSGESVLVAVPPGDGGTLVLADAYYPGWTVTVDGHPVTIGPFEGFLRSVPVPAGAHEVLFSYWPRLVQVGLVISGLGLLLTTLVALFGALQALTPGRRPASRSTGRSGGPPPGPRSK
jgi:Bacterial membrane protein YfhO